MKNAASSKILLTISFILSPLLSIPLIWHEIKSNNKFSLYILGAVFSLFGAYLPPSSDAYRYRQLYYTAPSIKWDSIFDTEQKDFLFQLLSNIFNNIGFSFELFKFVLLLCSYSLYIWMFLDIVKTNNTFQNNKKLYLLTVLSVLFSIRLFTLAYGIRFGFASTIVVVSIYLFFQKKYFKAIIIYVISLSMHFSMMIILPIIVVAFLLTKIKTIKPMWKILSVIVVLIFFNSSIGNILSLVAGKYDIVQNTMDGYISGFWNTENILSTASLNGIIFSIIRILPVFPLSFIILKQNKNTMVHNICFMLIMLLCVSCSSITLLLRYSNITIAVLFITYLSNLENTKKSIYHIKTIFIFFLMVFFSYAYAYRKDIINGYCASALITPISLYENPYTQEWIANNISLDGERL